MGMCVRIMTVGFPIPLITHGFGVKNYFTQNNFLRSLAQRTGNFVDVSMKMIRGLGGSNGRRHGNGGGACSTVDQMGITSGQCHKD